MKIYAENSEKVTEIIQVTEMKRLLLEKDHKPNERLRIRRRRRRGKRRKKINIRRK